MFLTISINFNKNKPAVALFCNGRLIKTLLKFYSRIEQVFDVIVVGFRLGVYHIGV